MERECGCLTCDCQDYNIEADGQGCCGLIGLFILTTFIFACGIVTALVITTNLI